MIAVFQDDWPCMNLLIILYLRSKILRHGKIWNVIIGLTDMIRDLLRGKWPLAPHLSDIIIRSWFRMLIKSADFSHLRTLEVPDPLKI